MASGEVATKSSTELAELPRGWVVTNSGRLSGVTEPGELSLHYPFPVNDLVFLDDALKYGSRAARARFAVFLGDLGADTAATARPTGRGPIATSQAAPSPRYRAHAGSSSFTLDSSRQC